MSGIWLTPASSGTVSPAYLDQVRELHTAVRDWITASATAQKNAHLLANLPYVDLMFAFGFATLGDHPTANKLVEAARKVMEGPIPPQLDPEKDPDPVTVGLVRSFMLKALKYRVEQALEGKEHIGTLSAEILADREALMRASGIGPINNPHKHAVYIIERLREYSRLVEPTERVDTYALWDTRNPVRAALNRIQAANDPTRLAAAVRQLLTSGVEGVSFAQARFDVLCDVLPLAHLVGGEFAVELLHAVPSVLAWGAKGRPHKLMVLLEAALVLAGQYGCKDAVAELIDTTVRLIPDIREEARTRIVGNLLARCLPVLDKLGFSTDAQRFRSDARAELTRGVPLAELRVEHTVKPDRWGQLLRILVLTESPAVSQSALEALRRELLSADAIPLQPLDYTDLARAYIGELGKTATGLPGMLELFRKMSPSKITNTWTTARYYSRFHLELVEDTVFAVCRLGLDNPTPAIVQA